jgi:hypothetical protein
MGFWREKANRRRLTLSAPTLQTQSTPAAKKNHPRCPKEFRRRQGGGLYIYAAVDERQCLFLSEALSL